MSNKPIVNRTFSRNCTLFSLSSFQIKKRLESTPIMVYWDEQVLSVLNNPRSSNWPSTPLMFLMRFCWVKPPLKWCSNAKYSLSKSEDIILTSFKLVWHWISAIYVCVYIYIWFYIYILKGPFLISFWIEGFDWIFGLWVWDSEGLAY